MAEWHPYRVLVDRKVREAIRGNVLAFSFTTSVDFSLSAPYDDVASLASKSEKSEIADMPK